MFIQSPSPYVHCNTAWSLGAFSALQTLSLLVGTPVQMTAGSITMKKQALETVTFPYMQYRKLRRLMSGHYRRQTCCGRWGFLLPLFLFLFSVTVVVGSTKQITTSTSIVVLGLIM
jgi:hypothetical protein